MFFCFFLSQCENSERKPLRKQQKSYIYAEFQDYPEPSDINPCGPTTGNYHQQHAE